MSVLYEKKDATVSAEYRDQLGFDPHFHSHIELVYMLEGEPTASVNFQEYALRPGDVFITFPNQIHHYRDNGASRSMILIFPNDLFPDYARLFRSRLPACPVLRGADAEPSIRLLMEEALAAYMSDEPYAGAVAKGYTAALLGLILRRMTFLPVKSDDLDTARGILAYCSEHYAQDLRLDDLARDLHISKFHISHLFSEKLHIHFCDYINTLRVGDACARLRDGSESVTDIAFAVGFNSLRSFNRVFLRQMAMTPRQYQKTAAD